MHSTIEKSKLVDNSYPFSRADSGSGISVIGIVTSLGGLKAVTQLLAGLPANFPVPILLLMHYGRASVSIVDHLSRYVALPVHWAIQGEILRPATVTLAPPDASLHAYPDGTISLVPADEVIKAHETPVGWPSADQFLTSLAFSYGPGALAVILTGMGRNGAAGAQAVKRQGGIVIAQDQTSSTAWDMPRAAIQTGCVDFVLPLEEMARVLVDIASKGLTRSPQELQASEALFSAGGVTGAGLHAIDWSRTSLGRVLDWSQSLCVTLRNLLASSQP